jgi:hypothetical protein
MNAHAMTASLHEPTPIEIDPRPCGLCGATIDQHKMVDSGEGPEFFCADEPPQWFANSIMTGAAADIMRRWERETPPKASSPQLSPRPYYRTPQSTLDAFWYVASLDDPDHLARWLANHPRDVAHLLKIWKAKQC